MEQLFEFPARAMGLGLVQMPQMQIPIPCRREYSLNPNAVEFVPSFRQKSEPPSPVTKTESTSTTTLQRTEVVGDAVNRVENGFFPKRQIFELLSQLGDEQMPLDEIAVGVLPGGHGLSMTFNTKQHDKLQSLDRTTPVNHGRQCLLLAVGDQEKLANRPETVLVAQFLIRVNDLLNEKYEYGGDASVCPRCTLCSNRSYTELEIENQIDCIKAFEKFFTFSESTLYQDLVSHNAFKELCHRLGLIVSRDQIHVNRACTVVPPPTAQSSSVTVCMSKNEMAPNVEAKAYSGDDDSHSNGSELAANGGQHQSISNEYVRGKLYRYEDSDGSQVVNEMSENQQHIEPMMVDDFQLDLPPTTPPKTVATTSVPATFPRVYKTAKAKCSARGAGSSGQQSGYGNRAVRSMMQPAKGSPTASHCRTIAVGGHQQAGSAAPRKLPMDSCPTGVAGKQNRLTQAKSGCVYQPSGSMQGVATGRVTKQGKAVTNVQKPQSNHICKPGKNSTASRIAITNQKQTNGNSQRMMPRSTNASMMRQSEVKRRMSLMRGDSDLDLLYNEYLFK
ncbi:uncharacterized protein LOC6526938 [Drosophila yakuba]|uniref:Uncharacterized protein n=1 Tax=Drosophila yakuba TaxID=7245 RepID=B4NZJ9_DROYA|nr:uncharacterized protein LOC6526938 [Drosophila yakuba]EDW87748.2 uncharacterized protein Dyak_GE14575 [Drosophila yakuba]